MSLWMIAWRSIQQRTLASVLTGISMGLGVALVVAVLVLRGTMGDSFRNNASLGYNVIVGAKGSKLQLVLNTVFYLSSPVENVPYSYYKEFVTGRYKGYVAKAIPCCLGDYYDKYRVVGTTPEMFTLELSGGRQYECDQGRIYRPDEYFGAVVGSTVAADTGLKVGQEFRPTHGAPGGQDAHEHDPFTVVGVLKPTGTPNDRAVFINIEGFYLLDNHARPVDPDLPALPSADAGSHPREDHDHSADHDHDADHHHDADHEHDEHEHAGQTLPGTSDIGVADHDAPGHADHDHDEQMPGHGAHDPTSHDPASHDPANHDAAGHDHADHDHADHDHDEHELAAKDVHAEDGHGAAHDHAQGHDHGHGHHHEPLPENQREVTAILLLTSSPNGAPPELTAMQIIKQINKGSVAQAVLPIREIVGLFDLFVGPLEWLLLALTVLIVIVAGIGILVSIYNSMSERRREIAVMRALGAGRSTVMRIILLESILLSLAGGFLGWLLGHLLIAGLGPWMRVQTGVSLGFFQSVPGELVIIPGLVLLASIVGYLPAMVAYRTDVAKALVAAP